ncbi:hypothetical protein DL95DRAFT_412265 [Leptodontidium sp. 2 PMI_412]|nr:hypothetical protein DL95DRAFT_412265 [Leptodontidium sp. 2 PMI_412]
MCLRQRSVRYRQLRHEVKEPEGNRLGNKAMCLRYFDQSDYRGSKGCLWTRKPKLSRSGEIEEIEDGDILIFNVVTGETQPVPIVGPSLEETPECQPRYEALLATWGDSNVYEHARVQMEDSPASGKLFATLGLRSNLTSALRCLRYLDEIRILWIDAICTQLD